MYIVYGVCVCVCMCVCGFVLKVILLMLGHVVFSLYFTLYTLNGSLSDFPGEFKHITLDCLAQVL